MQLFWRLDEVLNVTKCPAVFLDIFPSKRGLGVPATAAAKFCTSSVGHAHLWGPSYSYIQLITFLHSLQTHVLTILTQILPSCCLCHEKEPPPDCREDGWVLQKARSIVSRPPCTLTKTTLGSARKREGNILFLSAVTQANYRT